MLADVNGRPPLCVGVDVSEGPQCVNVGLHIVCVYAHACSGVHENDCIWLHSQDTMSRMHVWELVPFGVRSRYNDSLVNTTARRCT